MSPRNPHDHCSTARGGFRRAGRSRMAQAWSRLRLAPLGWLLALGAPALHADLKPGDLFPALDQTTLVGGVLPDTAGKVTLVDFWASWCAPCKESFPFYGQLHADYAARGLRIVAVSVDQNEAVFAAFVKRMSPPFTTLRDRDQQLVRQVKVPAMPTCYLIGRDGRVHFFHQGFHGAETEELIRREIDSLLAEIPPSS